MTTAKLGRRGQLTLPREVRERLRLEEGQRIAFVIKGDEVVLQPLTTTLRDLRGSVQVAEPQDFDVVRETVKRARAEAALDDG
ncbi:MAG: AbrB/MazE/SpoVT family DNA-binding domain-containing protein [Trueperaceae bacterium]|nr:AbrB/MazE/SpoVT family DNA-binding domain-containing protein [Trueperaceae bacterium]